MFSCWGQTDRKKGLFGVRPIFLISKLLPRGIEGWKERGRGSERRRRRGGAGVDRTDREGGKER